MIFHWNELNSFRSSDISPGSFFSLTIGWNCIYSLFHLLAKNENKPHRVFALHKTFRGGIFKFLCNKVWRYSQNKRKKGSKKRMRSNLYLYLRHTTDAISLLATPAHECIFPFGVGFFFDFLISVVEFAAEYHYQNLFYKCLRHVLENKQNTIQASEEW